MPGQNQRRTSEGRSATPELFRQRDRKVCELEKPPPHRVDGVSSRAGSHQMPVVHVLARNRGGHCCCAQRPRCGDDADFGMLLLVPIKPGRKMSRWRREATCRSAEVYAYEPVPASLTPAEAQHVLQAHKDVYGVNSCRHPSVAEYMVLPGSVPSRKAVWSPREKRDWLISRIVFCSTR